MNPLPPTLLGIGMRPSKDPNNPTYWERRWKSSDGAIYTLRTWEARSQVHGCIIRFPQATVMLCYAGPGSMSTDTSYPVPEVHTAPQIDAANIAARQLTATLFAHLNSKPRPAINDLAHIWTTCVTTVHYTRPPG